MLHIEPNNKLILAYQINFIKLYRANLCYYKAMKKLSFVLILSIFQIPMVIAGHLYPEKFYQKNWCKENHGIMEYKLIDDTRVDCLTKDYAVEFDFATKWAEAIGQSLHYSRMTGKKAGINLIIEDKNDFKYYHRIEPLCKQYDIALWYSEIPKNPPQDDEIEFSADYIIALLVKFIKYLFSFLG